MTTFGFECELAGGATAALQQLADRRLAPGPGLHRYHCECSDCEPTSEWAYRGQEDCTVDGELITKILEYDSDEASAAIVGLSESLLASRAMTGEGAGFHVHVGKAGMHRADRVRLYRLFLRYQDDLAALAATSFSNVRSYNSRLRVDNVAPYSYDGYYNVDTDAFWYDTPAHVQYRPTGRGEWLAQREATFEYRLWNSTRAEWRMRLAVGVSVAMVHAALDKVNVTPQTTATLEETLADYFDATTWAGIIRQRHSRAA